MVATTGVQRPNDEQEPRRIGRSRGIYAVQEKSQQEMAFMYTYTRDMAISTVYRVVATTGDVMWMGYEPTSSSEGINTHMKHKRILRLKRQ